ncbi:MAG: asparagine synthase (glutamine-hydrolyzing) [Spirochaetales bacterium]|jgi:asparagine synthase (glutamine-hydrolysing)|nr:asparagine synthase (glutamine-hydrolyzing) [Spirochaetales bacterium]
MCGFSGFLTAHSSTQGSLEGIATRMALSIQHRGPDDMGTWVDESVGIALGHQRLSIVDLSPTGHQPMVSSCGRFVIAFNGEIYNHLALRQNLKQVSSLIPLLPEGEGNHPWRGHSDTETLLAGFVHWGFEETLQRTVGMFALALWDMVEEKLYLARDRMGEKPLYYGWVDGSFVFGSELKALKAYPDFHNGISREALSLYLQHNYVPAPYSIYEQIYKLEPGCLLCVTPEVNEQPPTTAPGIGGDYKGLSLARWWSLAEVVQRGIETRLSCEDDAMMGLEQHLRNSIRLQSIADVPLGAFLSGGIDSSLIVALMQSEAVSPVKTFTIGFHESDHNEAVHAREVARHLGTEHTEVYISSADTLGVIPKLPELYDEPFADSSQIPTFLVAQMAKQHVTVALSGDAGDELFGGYNRYLWSRRIWDKFSWLPFAARHALGRLLLAQPAERLDKLASWLLRLVSRRDGVSLAGEKVHKVADLLLRARNLDDLYRSVIATWKSPPPVIGAGDGDLFARLSGLPHFSSQEERMMYLDAMSYLPDDILCKVDRAAMGVSLETRVPFLDHRVVEYAWQLPISMKIKDGQGKWPLRQLLYKYVPKELIERPKQGFGIPLAEWLRGPLQEWAETLLDEQRLRREGFLDPEPIRKKWQDHLAGRGNWQHHLWSVLMFQAWLEGNR